MKSVTKVFLTLAVFVLCVLVSPDPVSADACWDQCRENSGTQVCNCRCYGQCTRPDTTPNPGVPYQPGFTPPGGSAGGEETTPGICGSNQTPANGWFQCGAGTGGAQCTFCLKAVGRTCNQVLAERSCGTGFGGCSAVEGPVTTYYCADGAGGGANTPCQRNDPLPAGVHWNATNHNIVGSFCGTVQVDENSGGDFCSRTDTSGCTGTGGTPPVSTPTPTPAPVAQCVNIKIYTPNWTLIDANTFFNLTQRSQVHFCVAGSTNLGTFTKARFTINNTLRPETTLTRPGSSDFCDLYTIPDNTYNFAIQGEVYHETLGWR